MCTLTWLTSETGYQVFFNRDELKTRQRAIPPRIHKVQGTACIAPIDRDAGGTWISVNQQAVTLCLLNNYQADLRLPERDWVSRGLLVKTLAHLSSTDAVINTFEHLSMTSYKPFDLLVFGINKVPCRFSWDGNQLSMNKNPEMPATSSSFNTPEVVGGRIAQIDNSRPLNDESLLAFHRSHIPEQGAYSVCMHREDASTVSFSHIQTTEDQIIFNYSDGSPCSTGQTHRLSLTYRSALQSDVA